MYILCYNLRSHTQRNKPKNTTCGSLVGHVLLGVRIAMVYHTPQQPGSEKVVLGSVYK